MERWISIVNHVNKLYKLPFRINPLKIEVYILLACLTSNNATVIDRKTGAHAAIKGFNMPFTPRELEKKDKT